MPLPEPAATRSVLAPAPWSRWLWVGLAAVAALTALDVAVDRQVVLAGALAAVALAVGLLGHRGDALVVGAAALVAALGATAWDAGDATEQAIAIAVTATAGVTAFVTAVLRDAAAASARQFALLRGLAELADGASSVETTIDRVLDLLVPAVADVCALDLVIDHEQVRLGARVAGGEGGELEQALLRRRPAPRSVGAGTAQALRVQQSLLMDPITDELLTAVAATPEDLARLRAAGLRAALFLPLVARSRLLGAVSLVVGRSGRRYHEPDLRFGELLAGRIGIVLDNAGLSAQALEAERRLAAALDALGEAVTINDRDGRTVYANRAAAALLKVEDPEDLYGGEVGAISAAFAIYDEAGAPVPISAMPAFRALAGEPDPEPLLVRNVVKATGEERWLLNKVTVLRDGAGEPERVVNVIEDVTAVKRAERHQRLLAESTRALSRSLDPQRTLQHVAETAVPGAGRLVRRRPSRAGRRGGPRRDGARRPRARRAGPRAPCPVPAADGRPDRPRAGDDRGRGGRDPVDPRRGGRGPRPRRRAPAAAARDRLRSDPHRPARRGRALPRGDDPRPLRPGATLHGG